MDDEGWAAFSLSTSPRIHENADMAIKQLSETLISQIAAGEVIERPASAAKELIENALDAGATRIEIATAGGGKALLRVSDNGAGMEEADLELAVRRHCTSKISDTLEDIRTLGFRGEALPSIGSVAKLSIASRKPGSGQASAANHGPAGPEPLPEGGRRSAAGSPILHRASSGRGDLRTAAVHRQ